MISAVVFPDDQLIYLHYQLTVADLSPADQNWKLNVSDLTVTPKEPIAIYSVRPEHSKWNSVPDSPPFLLLYTQ
jgi:hypothetical protein